MPLPRRICLAIELIERLVTPRFVTRLDDKLRAIGVYRNGVWSICLKLNSVCTSICRGINNAQSMLNIPVMIAGELRYDKDRTTLPDAFFARFHILHTIATLS